MIDYFIPHFIKRVDNQAEKIGTFGNPPYSAIMYNRLQKKTYYLHYIKEFWRAFGRYYPHLSKGYGMSVAKEELKAGKINSTSLSEEYWTIVAMPSKTNEIVFYGLKSDKWYDYCEFNNTWHFHTAGILENGSIPATMLINMEKIK
jgi:hypothetical protein